MEVLFFLIPLSVALAAGFTIACLGSIRDGQFDDMESPRWRVLFDRNEKRPESTAVKPAATGLEMRMKPQRSEPL
ncbi:MAG: nitrogen fixation protein fixS [Fibrobacteria bacterium]|jgi:cbb3-type cytochrome oxidase maturation protein|nr:nitrogen fixation protein fixS [Fibrobacteria bacterium]